MKNGLKIRTIIVTDGDLTAQQAVSKAAQELNLYPIMASGGNPTHLNGAQIMEYIIKAPYDPVVVMVDDRGCKGAGPGETVLEYLLQQQDLIEILGVVAVASNTSVYGVKVDRSVTADGKVLPHRPVDKEGYLEPRGHNRLEGDTVEILNKYPELTVVGTGDIGKMGGYDTVCHGAEVTKRCLRTILEGRGIPIV